jgi:hypothetical protein
VAIGAIVAATVGILNALPSAPAPPPGCTVTTAAGPQYTLNPAQAQNAAIIAAIAFRQHLPDHAVTVALAVAMQESELENLPYGDQDSLGLFQQRPSQGWGTPAQLLDPSYAASAFFGRLVQIPGWQAMPVTEAAQAVQLSAAPDAYAAWEGEARAWAVALTGEAAAGLSCHFGGFARAAPAAAALGQALTSQMGTNLLGVPLSTKVGWQTASWVVAHAYEYHVRRVTFAGRTWQSHSGKWTSGPAPEGSQVVTVMGG